MQIRNGKRHSFKYESGVWSEAEIKYDAIKRECRAVLKCLKKFRYYLYEIRFVLKTDAEVLIAQFNKFDIDFSEVFLTRWFVWIRLFDFDVRHVKSKKHTAVDGLSRRPETESERLEKEKEMDINE